MRIVLLAAYRLENTVIAARLDAHARELAVAWPATRIRGVVVAQVKAIACEPPGDRGVPQSRRSVADLAAQADAEGLVDSVSRSTVRRWVDTNALRPWQHRSWIFPATRTSRSGQHGCWTCISGSGRTRSCPMAST